MVNLDRRFDVVALGELLIDFTESGVSEQGNLLLEAYPGGAPCNVLSMLSRLGHKTAFIGKVGRDGFGLRLRETLKELGIDGRGLLTDNRIHTTLAFVHKLPNGDRDFSFYRNPGADMMLTADEVPEELIGNARIFHFGSLSMTHPWNREATVKALRTAKKRNCLISFDPNLRAPLWDDLEEARRQIAFGIACCDILKISDDELAWFTGKSGQDAGIAILQEQYRVSLILLSKGPAGSSAYYQWKERIRADAEPFLMKNTVETTGAGDTFCACALHYLLEHGIRDLSQANLEELLRFANAAAAIITTRKGALRVMPAREEIESLIGAAG